MFFAAITKYPIIDSFQSTEVREFNINSMVLTIATDDLMSKVFFTKDAISIIESPLISLGDPGNIIFSEMVCSKNDPALSLSKPTISGRQIFYHINSAGEFFCSTHIKLLRTAGVKIEENTDVLPELFTYNFVMPPQTLYKNIVTLKFPVKPLQLLLL